MSPLEPACPCCWWLLWAWWAWWAWWWWWCCCCCAFAFCNDPVTASALNSRCELVLSSSSPPPATPPPCSLFSSVAADEVEKVRETAGDDTRSSRSTCPRSMAPAFTSCCMSVRLLQLLDRRSCSCAAPVITSPLSAAPCAPSASASMLSLSCCCWCCF